MLGDHPGSGGPDSPSSRPGCTDWTEKGPRAKGFPRPQSRGRMEFPGKKTTLSQPPAPKEEGGTRCSNSPCLWSASFNLWSWSPHLRAKTDNLSWKPSQVWFILAMDFLFLGPPSPAHTHSTVLLRLCSLTVFTTDFLCSEPVCHQPLTTPGLCSSSGFCWPCSGWHPRRPAQSWHVPAAQSVVLSE